MTAPDADARPVRRIGPYELLRELGRGGFAEVWLARPSVPVGSAARVAIKTVKTELRAYPSFQKMLVDEANLAAQIDHPNVVRVLELGDEGGLAYLVMEYVRGRPLNVLGDIVRRAGTPVPVGIVMRILADTCAGLHAAHELARDGAPLGVIHRDVSPQNILVRDDGTVKLIDFGVAKANEAGAAATAPGHAKGKHRYMAPEQATARPIDRRADLWAVGAVAFELLEGRPPYDAEELAQLYLLTDALPRPAFTTDVPAPIAEVIAKALERDADARWQTAAEMRMAIEAALEACGLAVTAGSVTAFFGEALSSTARGDDDEAQSDSAVLRGRLERPSMRAMMDTIDVPPPEAPAPAPLAPRDEELLAEPTSETLTALETSPHGVPRRPSRARVAAVLAVAVLVLGVGALTLGLRRASPSAAAPTPTPTPTPAPPPTPTPTPTDEASVTPAPPAAPPSAAPSKKPALPAKPSRPRPSTPPRPANR
jgi:serine/threonine-protein kinase